MGQVGQWWSLRGGAGRGVITLEVDELRGCSPGLEIGLLLRGTGQDSTFSKNWALWSGPLLQGLPFFFLRWLQA